MYYLFHIYYHHSAHLKQSHKIDRDLEQASKNQYLSETDELIDIDTLLSEMKTEPKFPEPTLEPVVDQVSVRNYVIFDEIEFAHEGINKITIGRQYDDPKSEVSASWCYVDKYLSLIHI